jgi:hypothetical protein
MKERKTTVILDSSHHAMRLMSICRKQDTAEEGYQLFKYMYLNGIFKYIDEFNADEFIIALDDSKGNWRRNVFPFYKGHRKIQRKHDQEKEEATEGWFNYKEYYQVYNELVEEITKSLPLKVLKVPYAEADDLAGVLCHSKELEHNHKILVTTDKDYIQLLEQPYTALYNPLKKTYVHCDDPKKELLKKVLMGDKGDYVPSVKDKRTFKPEFLEWCVKQGLADNPTHVKVKLESDDLILMEWELKFQDEYGIKPSRVAIFSEKMANGVLETDGLQKLLEDDAEIKKKFLRNNKLVNLDAQPQGLKDEIIRTYNETKIVGLEKMFEFFVSQGFNSFLDDTSRLTAVLKALTEVEPVKC